MAVCRPFDNVDNNMYPPVVILHWQAMKNKKPSVNFDNNDIVGQVEIDGKIDERRRDLTPYLQEGYGFPDIKIKSKKGIIKLTFKKI